MNKKNRVNAPFFLEGITDFYIYAATKGVIVNGTGTKEETGSEGESLDLET